MAIKYDAAAMVKRAEANQARLARDHVVPLAFLKLSITAPWRHHLHVVDVQVEIVISRKWGERRISMAVVVRRRLPWFVMFSHLLACVLWFVHVLL